MERTKQVPAPVLLPPSVSTKVMWFPLWSVALDTCSSEYASMCMRLCANNAVEGTRGGESGGTGWGGAGSQRQALLNPRMKKEQRIYKMSKITPLTTPGAQEHQERGIRAPGWGWESRNLNSRPGSAINFLGLTFLSLSFLLCKKTIIWLPTSLGCFEII